MNQEMAEKLVRTGADTPMGKLMRRYWVPVLMSEEIAEPDGPQVRVQILGEKLLAFRDTDGLPGLISEFCSHRGVSLYFGRNEENGIRCSYHGLKFDRTGKCSERTVGGKFAFRTVAIAATLITRVMAMRGICNSSGRGVSCRFPTTTTTTTRNRR